MAVYLPIKEDYINMQNLRFNGFAMIHKALRSMLYDAASELQQADFTDALQMEPILVKVGMIVELFDDHADHEDTHILSMIADDNEALVEAFEQEHITDRALSKELLANIAAYRAAEMPVARIKAGQKLFYTFNDFMAFNLTHMNREETVLNEALWTKYTDMEIGMANQKISASVPPEKAVINVTWMMRSCSNMEIAEFVKKVKAGLPEQMVNMMLGIAEQELPEHRYSAVMQQIEEQQPA
ncbi:MAG: hypothetical protein ACTHJ0_17250 [Flavipsychrobacter sp.]